MTSFGWVPSCARVTDRAGCRGAAGLDKSIAEAPQPRKPQGPLEASRVARAGEDAGDDCKITREMQTERCWLALSPRPARRREGKPCQESCAWMSDNRLAATSSARRRKRGRCCATAGRRPGGGQRKRGRLAVLLAGDDRVPTATRSCCSAVGPCRNLDTDSRAALLLEDASALANPQTGPRLDADRQDHPGSRTQLRRAFSPAIPAPPSMPTSATSASFGWRWTAALS